MRCVILMNENITLTCATILGECNLSEVLEWYSSEELEYDEINGDTSSLENQEFSNSTSQLITIIEEAKFGSFEDFLEDLKKNDEIKEIVEKDGDYYVILKESEPFNLIREMREDIPLKAEYELFIEIKEALEKARNENKTDKEIEDIIESIAIDFFENSPKLQKFRDLINEKMRNNFEADNNGNFEEEVEGYDETAEIETASDWLETLDNAKIKKGPKSKYKNFKDDIEIDFANASFIDKDGNIGIQIGDISIVLPEKFI